MDESLIASLRQEIRRGSVVLACLLALRQADYGYSVLRVLEQSGIGVEANTLYPLLRRLEKQGLLSSEWVTDDPRPRKYYQTSALGAEVAALLVDEWDAVGSALQHLKKGEED